MTEPEWTELPTGALAVGSPPIALRRIARTLARARGDVDAALAAAYPTLDPETLPAIVTRIETDPAAVQGQGDAKLWVSLALARGIGLSLACPAVFGLTVFGLFCLAPERDSVPKASLLPILALGVLTLQLGWIPALGLLRARAWANRAALAAAWLAVLLYGRSAGLSWGVLSLGLLALGLLGDPLARWQRDATWRAAADSLSVRAYLAATAPGLAVLAFLPVNLQFKEIFMSMGVELPMLTRSLLDLSELFQTELGLLYLPALLLVPTPALRCSLERESSVVWAGVTATILAIWGSLGAIFLPIYELQRALAQ